MKQFKILMVFAFFFGMVIKSNAQEIDYFNELPYSLVENSMSYEDYQNKIKDYRLHTELNNRHQEFLVVAKLTREYYNLSDIKKENLEDQDFYKKMKRLNNGLKSQGKYSAQCTKDMNRAKTIAQTCININGNAYCSNLIETYNERVRHNNAVLTKYYAMKREHDKYLETYNRLENEFNKKQNQGSNESNRKFELIRKITQLDALIKTPKNSERKESSNENQIVNGYKEGLHKQYYSNGQLKEEQFYKNGLCAGVYKRWDENGNLIEDSKCINKENRLQRVDRQFYYPSGKFKSKGSNLPGNEGYVRIGIWEIYYENGQIKSKENYKNGKLDGTLTQYFDNGAKSYEGIYIDGKENGTIKWFFDSGKLKESSEFVNGKKHGKTTTYHKNGKIEYTTQNKNGCRYGETFWFFDNGQLEQKAIYKYQVGNESGLRWEILEVFDINGNPLDKGTLKEGNGTWKSYDKNGNLTSTSIYKNGVKVD